jgi:hypothetical protein
MTTFVKILLGILLGALLNSCKADFNYGSGIKGNKNVITKTRNLKKDFSKISASEGLEVIISQNNENSIKVQADENLHQYIITEVVDGILKLHTSKQLGKADSKKVYINFKKITNLSSSSGSSIKSLNEINTRNISINATSGSNQNIYVATENLNCSSSSGASIKLKGKSSVINATANSGSYISAIDLKSSQCNTTTSSGASIKVYCSSEINSTASSGSSIKFDGNPKQISKTKSSGARISSY